MSNIAAAQQAAFAQAATSATTVADDLVPPGVSLSLSDLQALFGTGLSQSARLIEIESAQGSALPDSLVVERFHGTEGVNQLFQFEVDCLSVSTHVELTQFIGEEITLRLLLPGGGKRAWHGYCTSAAWLGADGGLARYRLTLSPFLAFLALRTDAFIFQDKDALGILEELFKDYPQANVRYEVTQKLAPRAVCTQYQESDLQFLTRLLAQEGLSYRFEHAQGGAGLDGNTAASPTNHSARSSQNSSETASSSSSSSHAKHCLVVFDAPSSTSQWPQLVPSAIRFHRAAATEAQDGITRFSASRQVGANAVALSAWDPAQLVAPSAEAASSLNAGALPQLAVYEGAGQRRYPDAAAASQIAQLRLQALELPSKSFSGTSSARQLAAGSRFSLTQHDHYPETSEANQFKLLQVEHAAANNLPAQVAPLLAGLGGQHSSAKHASSLIDNSAGSSQKHSKQHRQGSSGATAGQDSADANSDDLTHLERGTYRNRFTCVRAAVPVVPLLAAAPLRATAPGPQTAMVVGLEGEQLSTQRNHGVKVQFAWQRGAAPLPGGLSELNSPNPAASDTGNAPGNETSGTWVRVAEALAGPNWGSQFTPRIGTEVLVDFVDGDLDQPVIVAQLYNGVDMPPFAAGVDAGVNHGGVLSGWHSHNLMAGKNDQDAGGESGGYNQWVLDDTSGQLRMRLASSTAASQLSTGYLIGQSPSSAQRGAYRGSGFELRTDAWGVLRAPEGLLISTTTRAQTGTSVASSQMDTLEARAQLKGAQSLTDALQDAASQAQALGATQVKDTQTAQKLLLERLDPKEKGSFKGQGVSSLNGQTTQKAQAGSRELDSAPEAAVERFGAPLIVAEAPSSILMSSPASTAIFAGEQLHIVTQGDAQYGAAHTVSSVSGKSSTLFTHEGGLEAVAANGPLSIQAHTDQLELLADKEVTVVSVNDSISINAKTKIVLKAGQTSITLDGANITFACPGTFSVKGSAHSMDGGASSPAGLMRLPDSQVKMYSARFEVKTSEGEPLPNTPYFLETSEREEFSGDTDERGLTERVWTSAPGEVKIWTGGAAELKLLARTGKRG